VIAVSVIVPSSVIIGVGIGLGFYFKKRRSGKQITTKLPNWLRRREKDADDAEELRELKSELENLPPHLFIPYDDLTFVKLLGSGAYGQVYEGTWQKSPVALKVSTNEQKKRFIQEVQLVSSIRYVKNYKEI
jgi:serine/threonine protein kinase